jgi:alkylation response protein AidB-like acyl-CoA dehydrogenase
VLEAARLHKLTRHQHVLFRLGELVAYAECAAALARRAAASATGQELSPKVDHRFDAGGLAALSRVFAREAALKVGVEGLRWLIGSDAEGGLEPAAAAHAVGIERIERAQRGMVADMATVADALYARFRS